MIIQVNTPDGIIELNSETDSCAVFENYGLDKLCCEAEALSLRTYSQEAEPKLEADNKIAIWIDTADNNRVYLIFRRGDEDQVAVELG